MDERGCGRSGGGRCDERWIGAERSGAWMERGGSAEVHGSELGCEWRGEGDEAGVGKTDIRYQRSGNASLVLLFGILRKADPSLPLEIPATHFSPASKVVRSPMNAAEE